MENFFEFPILFWRFWKTKVGGKKNWRKRENELNQGNLENFLSNSILGRFLIKVYGDFGKRKKNWRERERVN